MNYWQRRSLKSQAEISNRSINAIEKQMGKYYRRAMTNCIDSFEATLNKLLATTTAGKPPTPADLYKLDRYWQMQAQIKEELQRLGDKSLDIMQKRFIETYQGVYGNIALPSGRAHSTIDNALVKQLINSVWCADSKSWSERIWENTAKLAETLNEGLVECVLTGKKTTDLKKDLQERFLVSYSEADRLVRTEIAHIQTQAAEQRYKDAGVQKVEIWADKDERRCKVCGKLHQKQYPVGAAVPIPAHPNCRCCIIPVIE